MTAPGSPSTIAGSVANLMLQVRNFAIDAIPAHGLAAGRARALDPRRHGRSPPGDSRQCSQP